MNDDDKVVNTMENTEYPEHYNWPDPLNEKQMAGFLLELRDRQELPVSEDEYWLLKDIAERLTDIYKEKHGGD